MLFPIHALAFRGSNAAASLKRLVARLRRRAVRGLPRQQCRGLIEAFGRLLAPTMMQPAFRGSNAAASLKQGKLGQQREATYTPSAAAMPRPH